MTSSITRPENEIGPSALPSGRFQDRAIFSSTGCPGPLAHSESLQSSCSQTRGTRSMMAWISKSFAPQITRSVALTSQCRIWKNDVGRHPKYHT